MPRLRVPFALFWCVAAGLQAQELDRPLRAVHRSGNWGHTADAVDFREMDRTQRLVPLRYVEYLRSVQVDWVGFSVALHLEHSMDSTLERTYSGVRVQTFSDEAVRQIIREFRAHGFNVYMTLAIESFEQEHELDAVKHPAPRFQLGDPGYADTGVPDDHLYCTCARQIDPDFWPWRPSHPDHDLFVAEFWESYAQQAIHFASIAEEEGVRMYSLGRETERLFRTRPGGDYWINHFGTELQSMVDRVRAVYSGLLTYDMQYKAYWRDWFRAGLVAPVGRPRPGRHRRQLVVPPGRRAADHGHGRRQPAARVRTDLQESPDPDGGTQPRPAAGLCRIRSRRHG